MPSGSPAKFTPNHVRSQNSHRELRKAPACSESSPSNHHLGMLISLLHRELHYVHMLPSEEQTGQHRCHCPGSNWVNDFLRWLSVTGLSLSFLSYLFGHDFANGRRRLPTTVCRAEPDLWVDSHSPRTREQQRLGKI